VHRPNPTVRQHAELKDVIGEPTEQPWGIRVERVDVKDVALPEAMKRSMSRQAAAGSAAVPPVSRSSMSRSTAPGRD
jgi:regulator of protease activity HflC (stomatin/prohibitin superfamily)